MKGLLKSKPAGNQFLLLISIALVSFFILGRVGVKILGLITGVSDNAMLDTTKINLSEPVYIAYMRGMQVIQFIALFLIPSIICAELFSTNPKKYLGLKKPSINLYLIAGIAAMIVAIPLVNWLGALNKNIIFPSGIEQWLRSSEDEAARTTQALLSKHTINDLLLNVILIAGLAAVGEELLFRGMVQRLLIKMFKSPWPGIIVTAILFSAMHMQFYGFFPRLLLGILLGAIYWYSGSLWTAILAHFVYDGLLIVLVYFNPEMLNDDTVVKTSSLALAGSISFVLVVLLIEWMRKKTRATYDEVYADDEPAKNKPFDFE